MPSFDVVSEVDKHELKNAVDQAQREIQNRFDFKGIDATYSLKENTITIKAPSDFQVKQMQDILNGKMIKRDISVNALDAGQMQTNLAEARLDVTVKQGIDKDNAKKVTKAIKDSKAKVQTQIQGEQIRVTGKKRDDLQDVIAFLRDGDFELPLQYINFRD